MWDLNGRKQERHLEKTVRQKPKTLNNFMSNLAWQPLQPWTSADCLLLITEATSSAATGISTLLSASWGRGLGCFSPPGGSSKLHSIAYVEPSDWKKHKAANPHRWPRGEFSHAYLVRKWIGVFFSLPWLRALWQLHSAEGRKALPRAPLQLRMTHARRAPFRQI